MINLILITTFICAISNFVAHGTISFCDSPSTSGLGDGNALNNLGFQDPASPLMEGIIALHSDMWAIMLFVAGFVLTMILVTLNRFGATTAPVSYKVHHHNLIEMIWTTIPALILCVIAVPSFTLLYSLDEVVSPSLTVKAMGRQWYWCAPSNGDLDWKVSQAAYIFTCLTSQSVVLSDKTTKCSTYLTLLPQGKTGFLIKMAERLRGPKHVENGWLIRRCLGEYATQTKGAMVIKRNASGIHTSPQEDIEELEHSLRSNKTSVQIEPTGRRLLRHVGPRFSPKTLAKPNHWNSGLTKAGNGYVNGDSIVVKYYSEGSQFRTNDQPEVDSNEYTSGEALTPPLYLKYGYLGPRELEIGKYRSLFQPLIYKIAYDTIKSKPGNTTPGVDKQTLNGIGLAWIDKIIKSMKDRSFQFQPAVRRYIPKPNGKLRPLGIPTAKDKVIQQALKLIIEPLFEPHFLNSSHGFRPHRSAHTALKTVKSWTGITWMIEGDIKGCFDNVDHSTLEKFLKIHIKDQNLIGLYWKAVNAGYINNGNLEAHSLTGVPQGGILSPLLSNVYMHQLDVFVETLKLKYNTFTNRRGAKQNPTYTAKLRELSKLRAAKDGPAIRNAEFELRNVPSTIKTSTRIYYVRYADDWVIGVRGPKSMAENVKDEVKTFLQNELKLELSLEKTTIVHLATQKAFYLGTQIRRHSSSYSESLIRRVKQKQIRGTNSRILLECPINRIVKRLEEHGYSHFSDGQPKAVTKWIYMRPEEIILRYNAVIRDYLNYYSFTNNRNMLQRIIWILRFSAVFTLARKWNISPKQVFRKLGSNLTYKIENKTPKRFKTKSYSLDLGNLTIQPMKFDLINCERIIDPEKLKYFSTRSHFTLDKPCCVCGSASNVEMHHIRHLRKDSSKENKLQVLFNQIKRKQIPVCRSCHMTIHAGKYDGRKLGKLA